MQILSTAQIRDLLIRIKTKLREEGVKVTPDSLAEALNAEVAILDRGFVVTNTPTGVRWPDIRWEAPTRPAHFEWQASHVFDDYVPIEEHMRTESSMVSGRAVYLDEHERLVRQENHQHLADQTTRAYVDGQRRELVARGSSMSAADGSAQYLEFLGTGVDISLVEPIALAQALQQGIPESHFSPVLNTGDPVDPNGIYG